MHKTQLKKNLNFPMAFSLVVGMVIGSGVFFKATPVAKYSGSFFFIILAWTLGGIMSLAGALVAAEFSSRYPFTGGLYIYLEKLYGKTFAFLFGWMNTLIYTPAILSALSVLFADQIGSLTKISQFQHDLLAVLILTLIIFINVLGNKYGGIFQLVATILKLIPIFLIMVSGLLKPIELTYFESTEIATRNFGLAVLSTLWAYDGWLSVPNVAGEIKNAKKNLVLVLISGMIFVMGVYLIINISYINVLGISSLISSDNAINIISKSLFGNFGGVLISLGIIISIIGTLNGFALTGIRIPYAMAENNRFVFNETFKKLHPITATPINSTILIFIISLLYIFTRSFNRLTDLAMFSTWIFYVFFFIGIFIVRKREGKNKDGYNTFLYPLTPLIAIISGAYIVINNIISNPVDSIFSILLTLIGLPIYYIFVNKKRL
ncbi:APC family permease [Caldicellulosiruptoraceae bacterium PP1]